MKNPGSETTIMHADKTHGEVKMFPFSQRGHLHFPRPSSPHPQVFCSVWHFPVFAHIFSIFPHLLIGVYGERVETLARGIPNYKGTGGGQRVIALTSYLFSNVTSSVRSYVVIAPKIHPSTNAYIPILLQYLLFLSS